MKRLYFFKTYMCLFLSLFCTSVFAQKENSFQSNFLMLNSEKKSCNSELVFVNNSSLLNVLKTIIVDKKSCGKNDWYIDIRSKEQIIISQDRIANLLVLNEDKKKGNLFVTVINNQIVYLFVKHENETLIFKSRIQVDLSSFVGKYVLDFQHFSSWTIKNENDTYKIAGNKIIECD